MKIERNNNPWRWEGGISLEILVALVMQEWDCSLDKALGFVQRRVKRGNIFGVANFFDGKINMFTDNTR